MLVDGSDREEINEMYYENMMEYMSNLFEGENTMQGTSGVVIRAIKKKWSSALISSEISLSLPCTTL
jgi:hypothetical protein